jgi:uncharacterized protein YqeY
MINLSTIESDLTTALKARDSVRVETLRALKTRLQNEQIATASDSGRTELTEDQILSLIRSEVKRRKEAAQAFTDGDRKEQADRELEEAKILSGYLPAGPSSDQIVAEIDKLITENTYTAKDFGQAMGKLKALLPTADGGELASQLKAKLK